jgi:hypothetical protein
VTIDQIAHGVPAVRATAREEADRWIREFAAIDRPSAPTGNVERRNESPGNSRRPVSMRGSS